MEKNVLITGGVSGIGGAITNKFYNEQWTVLAHFHKSSEKATALSKRSNIQTFQADLSESKQCQSLANTIRETVDSLNGFVNNAAVFPKSSFANLSNEDWDTAMDINARAPFLLSKELSDLLKPGGGAIINITDWATAKPYSNRLPYFASKGALKTLTRGLARTLAPEIRVNAVAPGPITFPSNYDKQEKKRIINQTLLKRQGKPDEIARAVYFLLAEATFTTGSILQVDGGRHIN